MKQQKFVILSNNKKLTKFIRLLETLPNGFIRVVKRFLGQTNQQSMYYVVPDANWVTDWVGHYITTNINQQYGWRAHTTSTPQLLVDHILHYGEAGAFLHSLGSRRNCNNTIISTIFHGDISSQYPQLSENTQKFLDHTSVLSRIHVSCRIMKDRLLTWEVEPEKIIQIPLGVDTSHFKPLALEGRLNLRQKYGIPLDAVCIGSFQKDGIGWGDGLEPKLIKGPDIFLKVVENLHKDVKIFVFLSGPARGYVKKGLDRLGVPYIHTVVANYPDIVDLYACLDLYLVASREEGGPKAVLESLACGVPVVSTRVGLVPDIIRHGENGFLANIEDIGNLTDLATQIIGNEALRHRLIDNARNDILNYNWKMIAARYYHELYLPLLKRLD